GTVHSGPNRFPTTRMLRVLANYPVGAMKAVVFHGIGDIHLGGSARPQNSGAHGCYRPPHREAMMKNLTLGMGNCNHRKYIPLLIELVSGGVFDPSTILTQAEPLTPAIDASKAFDERQNGWVKVELLPAA